MPLILIGCGGWQYFVIPNMDPLRAYSLAFRFVEVNSTFYQIPSLGLVESWRKRVPAEFEFTVRINRFVSHTRRLRLDEKALQILERCVRVAETLRSNVLVLETPKTLNPVEALDPLKKILRYLEAGGLRLAWEPRAGWTRKAAEGAMGLGIIPVADYSIQDPPYEDEEIGYSRLFGKGRHNIYQFTDEELLQIRERAEKREAKKVYLSFHGVRMYLDAARLERFIKKGEFPRVTKSYGVDSLAEVLSDATFPSSKDSLLRAHGWKLIDIDERTRMPASVILKQLRKRSYRSLEEVIRELRKRFEGSDTV